MRAAFRLDRWLGRDRNDGVEPELHLPAPRLMSKAATLRLFPGVRQERLTGGAQWYDYQMVEADRLTLAFAAAADRAGADLVNYVEAVAALKDGGRVAGHARARRPHRRELTVRARVTLNAAGARAGDVMRCSASARSFPLLKAMNLVTSKPASDMALAAPTPKRTDADARPVARPRDRRHRPVCRPRRSPTRHAVTAAEVDAFIADANHAFPALKLTRDDVTLVHRGIVPAVDRSRRPAAIDAVDRQPIPTTPAREPPARSPSSA